MSAYNLLRKQVRSEVRKRNLIFYTFVILAFVYLSISLFLGDMGLLRYIEVKKTKELIEKQITDIDSKNMQLKAQIKLLKEDPFYKEKLAREEFGLAKPEELIFQYDR